MVGGTILHDSIKAKLERAMAPSYSCCGICGRPWKVVRGHSIDVAERRGCFAQCEDCWKSASDHDIRLCNELLYYDWLNSGINEEQIGFSKEHLMECVERALAERRGIEPTLTMSDMKIDQEERARHEPYNRKLY